MGRPSQPYAHCPCCHAKLAKQGYGYRGACEDCVELGRDDQPG